MKQERWGESGAAQPRLTGAREWEELSEISLNWSLWLNCSYLWRRVAGAGAEQERQHT